MNSEDARSKTAHLYENWEQFSRRRDEKDLAELERISAPVTTAVKHDQGKPDMSMVSLELMELVGEVRVFGAKKYSRNNWKNGFKVTRSLAAALRHIFAFLSGETLDPESKLSHLGHAICCLEHAVYDMKHHPENDDR